MRWVLDIIAILTAAGLIFAVVTHQRGQGQDEQKIESAAADLRRLELEIKYRAVTKSADLNQFGWPVTVDPAWFSNDPPRNTLLSPKRPWVELAGEAEAKLMQPQIRLAVDEKLAGFWYNPYQGVVRARVPVMMSDQDAVDLYNRLNGSSLRSVFDREGETPPMDLPAPKAAPVSRAPVKADAPLDAGATMPAETPPEMPLGAPKRPVGAK